MYFEWAPKTWGHRHHVKVQTSHSSSKQKAVMWPISDRFSMKFAAISDRFSMKFEAISDRFSMKFAAISDRFSMTDWRTWQIFHDWPANLTEFLMNFADHDVNHEFADQWTTPITIRGSSLSPSGGTSPIIRSWVLSPGKKIRAGLQADKKYYFSKAI